MSNKFYEFLEFFLNTVKRKFFLNKTIVNALFELLILKAVSFDCSSLFSHTYTFQKKKRKNKKHLTYTKQKSREINKEIII